MNPAQADMQVWQHLQFFIGIRLLDSRYQISFLDVFALDYMFFGAGMGINSVKAPFCIGKFLVVYHTINWLQHIDILGRLFDISQ